MKINETGRIGAMNSYQRQLDNQRQGDDKKAKRKDEVVISTEAHELLQADRDPARAERIQKLKSQVASGTYQIDSGKIAEKLVPYFKSYTEK